MSLGGVRDHRAAQASFPLGALYKRRARSEPPRRWGRQLLLNTLTEDRNEDDGARRAVQFREQVERLLHHRHGGALPQSWEQVRGNGLAFD
eukprot:8533619-Pyramimonas_sp.AAC.1